MDDISEMDEDQLLDYVIRLSIEDSCKELPSTKPTSSRAASDEQVTIQAAIEEGDTHTLEELCECPAAFGELDAGGWLPLHRAAVQPVKQVLKLVLDASYELNLEEKTLEGETALTLAVQAGHVENVKILLERGASPHNTNDKNESPLLLAIRIGSYELVSVLIENKALVDQVCLRHWTAMHEAAKVGCSDIAVLLLRNGARITHLTGHGVMPIGIAAEFGQTDVLDLLIQKGGDVNAQSYNGESVLYDAAGSGNPDCIDLLLQSGADPDVPSMSRHLPIHRAAYLGHYLALELLIQVTSRQAIAACGQSPVHSAADGGHVECLRLLIESGFDVNAILEKHISENYADMRKSALYFAVSNGDVTCAEMLLNAGANPDADPLRCLLVAVRAGRYEIVRLLLAKQADVNCYFTAVSDTVFPTALQYCLRDEMMMRLLLNNGYDAESCFLCCHDRAPDLGTFWMGLYLYEIYIQKDKIPFCDFIGLSWLNDMVGNVVRILLDYVSHVPICSSLKRTLEKKKEWSEICDILGSPRHLKHLCRLAIRRQMTPRCLCDPDIMDSFPFPHRLKDYLLYKEHDLYSRISGTSV
ncbi:ankyrin repeat and SOCS box protein 15-like isoform X1 [Scleropages formosus]|uniref:Ankyrin repeat and SOCS box containing 15 n=1 Tax=Scleropages formosus TaxID=113540 RepID=A0A8C9RKF7_SCLFO|nr:ankyrin repeat and SOCS box protein 15-like isoform X1 [Scleropages formosus]